VSELIPQLSELVAAEADAVVALRRTIHRRPELGFAEYETTERIASYLRASGLVPVVRPSGTGLTVEIGEGEPLVVFRADLDALPIEEANDVEYRSEIDGVMHACGHDAHSAMAAGLARVMAAAGPLEGRIRFVFQPAEETVPGGAVEMLSEGAVDGSSAAIAFHVDPSTPPGTVALRTGPITGASDRVAIELTGPGGHTSRPHQTVDLIQALARLVVDLPAYVKRVTDPRKPIALVFGRIGGGRAENVVPGRVQVAGTVRMFDLDLWKQMPPLIEKAAHDIATPLGAHVAVSYERGSPPVVNDPAVIEAVGRAARTVLGDEGVLPTEQSLGAEDFAWYLEEVPGALIRLGARLPDRMVDLHATDFDIDERAIPTGLMVGAVALLELLASG
jgi:amidohydrolase